MPKKLCYQINLFVFFSYMTSIFIRIYIRLLVYRVYRIHNEFLIHDTLMQFYVYKIIFIISFSSIIKKIIFNKFNFVFYDNDCFICIIILLTNVIYRSITKFHSLHHLSHILLSEKQKNCSEGNQHLYTQYFSFFIFHLITIT